MKSSMTDITQDIVLIRPMISRFDMMISGSELGGCCTSTRMSAIEWGGSLLPQPSANSPPTQDTLPTAMDTLASCQEEQGLSRHGPPGRAGRESPDYASAGPLSARIRHCISDLDMLWRGLWGRSGVCAGQPGCESQPQTALSHWQVQRQTPSRREGVGE